MDARRLLGIPPVRVHLLTFRYETGSRRGMATVFSHVSVLFPFARVKRPTLGLSRRGLEGGAGEERDEEHAHVRTRQGDVDTASASGRAPRSDHVHGKTAA